MVETTNTVGQSLLIIIFTNFWSFKLRRSNLLPALGSWMLISKDHPPRIPCSLAAAQIPGGRTLRRRCNDSGLLPPQIDGHLFILDVSLQLVDSGVIWGPRPVRGEVLTVTSLRNPSADGSARQRHFLFLRYFGPGPLVLDTIDPRADDTFLGGHHLPG